MPHFENSKIVIAMSRFFTLHPLIMDQSEIDYWHEAAAEHAKQCDAIEETSIAINLLKITMAVAEKHIVSSNDLREFLFIALTDSGNFNLDLSLARCRAA